MLDRLIEGLPEGWFLESMGEHVTRIIYAGEKHHKIFFYAKLQHRDGGRLTTAKGETLQEALADVIELVKEQEA